MYNKVSFLPFCGCISKEWHPLRAAISPVLPIFLYLLFETKFSRFEIHFGACFGEAISNLTKKTQGIVPSGWMKGRVTSERLKVASGFRCCHDHIAQPRILNKADEIKS